VDNASFRALLAPPGQEALQAADSRQPKREDFLAHYQQLSKVYPADLARAALEVAILRGEAVAKFPFAEKLYFTREALEQSSSFAVSSYRSERFRGFGRLADLGCSAGGDSFALAGIALTTSLERDPLRMSMARANLLALGLDSRVDLVRADLDHPLPWQARSGTGLFFDPARRVAGRRVFSVDEYQPPLRIVSTWLKEFPAVGVKISPGVNIEELASYDAEVEFISLGGELKEAVLWFGPLKNAARRATLLPGPHSLAAEEGYQDKTSPSLSLHPPLNYLYEPDPAILRAGLVRQLGLLLSAAQLDPDIAYLTSQDYLGTPFARAWPVESWFPFGLKRLRTYMRERGVGRIVVKKRGSPLDPQTLIRDLRLHGDWERTVFLTHLKGEPIVVVCFSGEV
jgi:hypothetical protein